MVSRYYDENEKRYLPWLSNELTERSNKKQDLVVAKLLNEKLEKELYLKTLDNMVPMVGLEPTWFPARFWV